MARSSCAGSTAPLHRKMKAHPDEAPGIRFGAGGVQLHIERFQRLTTAREDERDVRAHAAAERRAEELHG